MIWRTAAIVALLAAATACSSGSGSGGAPSASQPPPRPTATVTTTASPSHTPTASLLCAPSNTRTHDYGGQGAAGTEFQILVVTNIAHRPCHTGGYPGLLLVDKNGHAMPTKVHRDPEPAGDAAPSNPQFFEVPAGGDFYVEFSWSAAGRGCEHQTPPEAAGLRLTLPDNQASAYVALRDGGYVAACHGHLDAYRVFKRQRHD